jgi:hypothetical protein
VHGQADGYFAIFSDDLGDPENLFDPGNPGLSGILAFQAYCLFRHKVF